MSSYQRSFSREDPRLSKHRSSASPKESRKSPSRSSKTTTSSSSSTWDNRNQFTSQLQTSYQHLQPNNVYSISPYGNTTYYGYDSYNYNAYQYNQAGQAPYIQGGVAPPSEEYPQGSWSAAYPSQNSSAEFAQSGTSTTASNKKSEGVAEELNKQKESLVKEREIYEDRVVALKEKLKLLVDQKEQLSSKRSPDRETLHIIKENTKLQVEIQSKITDANNVIEILTNLIGDKKKEKSKESSKASSQDEAKVERINYKHYDPEIHWCRMCDVFPQSAKELLQHLHSKQHQKLSQEENPWHKLPPEPKFEEFEGAPSRRLPIKGLQFFVASTAWYCRLCDSWIGDLHCASQHLMSVTHSQNYSNFVEQNPHWEIEWLKDREKALERVKRTKSDSDSDDKKKKHKKEKYSPQSAKDKKKKKQSKKKKKHSSDSSSSSSSSSSSDDEREDKSKSIRVLMRNKIKMLTEGEEKWELINKIVEEERKRKELKQKDKEVVPPPPPEEDKLMSQWMTVSAPPDKDKQMLEGLKEKLKQKQDAEKARVAAESASKKLKEKEEYERKVKEKEKQALLEREEEQRRKEQERLSVKMKGEVKIRGKDNNYRKRRSHSRSRSPEHYRKRSRSRSSDRRPNRNGRSDESPKRHKDDEKHDKKQSGSNKRLPFIGRMPLFKNQKGNKKPEDDKKTKEIQKEDYDIPRKTRFQPGNLARAYIPKPDVVCFPKLSSYPPLAPPPPAILEPPPEPPKISSPKPPPAPTIEENQEESSDEEPEDPGKKKVANNGQPDYDMMYDESMYYGNMDFNMMYQPPPENFAFMQPPNSNDTPIPPLQPPPLPPDDPNDDLALLGLSSDDMAVQHL